MFRKITDQFSRFFAGGLFIFSGLIKLNDPIGTEIKLEEYFEVFGQDFGSFFLVFKPYALEIGMFLIVLEVVLGVGNPHRHLLAAVEHVSAGVNADRRQVGHLGVKEQL